MRLAAIVGDADVADGSGGSSSHDDVIATAINFYAPSQA